MDIFWSLNFLKWINIDLMLYLRTSSLLLFVKSSPTLPNRNGATLWIFSLYSLSGLRPIANEITLFLPNRNLDNSNKSFFNLVTFRTWIQSRTNYLLSDQCCLRSLRNWFLWLKMEIMNKLSYVSKHSLILQIFINNNVNISLILNERLFCV